LLFGVGVSVIVEQLRALAGDTSGSPAVDLNNKGLLIPLDDHLKWAFVLLGVSILSSFVAFPLARFSTPRFLGPWLILVYVAFLVVAVVTEAKA
jgi:MFS superfamily sulfate permease-like transporter